MLRNPSLKVPFLMLFSGVVLANNDQPIHDANVPLSVVPVVQTITTHEIPAVSNEIAPKDPSVETAMMVGEPAAAEQPGIADDQDDKEQIWLEISDAIASLNTVVGDEMFRDLQRKSDSQMEVRVDVGFWQRVRYQTRVDLKNDISNIWHLYVKQYYGGDHSSVRFIDDSTDKTIDIFAQTR